MSLAALAILLIVILTVRRITRPLKALSSAAERLGRGEDVEPLVQSGPVELQRTTAAFNAVVTLDKAFTVPAFARTLVVEIRTYGETVQTAGWWRADSIRYPGTNYTGGTYALINSDHCVTPSIFFASRAAVMSLPQNQLVLPKVASM